MQTAIYIGCIKFGTYCFVSVKSVYSVQIEIYLKEAVMY